jgi:hypothetical protein
MNENKTTIKSLAEEESPRVKLLRKQIKTLEKEREKLIERFESREEFADACSAAVAAMDPFPTFVPPTRKGRSVDPIVAVLDFSDWHVGEVIERSEVEGFNAYNFDIAQERIFGIISAVLKWVEVQRQSYVINEIHICGKGDYISGDIHKELQVTNEFPLPEQSVKAGLLLGECVRRIAGKFKTVVVEAVGADNHGRLNPKPQAKQKSSNNMSFIVHAMAQADSAKCHNVRWNIAQGQKLLADMNGFKFLLEHGDSIRGQMGIPYYGFQRLVGKEATRRMRTDKGFDYLSIGHFHVPAFIEGRTLVNGSLSGTSEFDHGQGRYAAPCQIAYFVHKQHGIFNLTPFQG